MEEIIFAVKSLCVYKISFIHKRTGIFFMTFAARKNISDDPLQRQTSSDDLLLQITVVHHYIEYNVSAARHSSNIAYTRNIVSMWNFISCMTEIEEIEAPRKTREDKSSNVGTFFYDWIISRIIAVPIVGASRRRKLEKKRHQ